VTYRVRFEAYALVQLHGLPSEAFDALLDRVVELVEAPWDAVVLSKHAFRGQPRSRYQTFVLHADCWPLPVDVEPHL
jgi:mRNA-degrading endonuclease RelE of RelBE toxin-antitoxin system